LQDKQGAAQGQHDQAEEGKKGLDDWKVSLRRTGDNRRVVLCVLDDPVDGMQLIAAGSVF